MLISLYQCCKPQVALGSNVIVSSNFMSSFNLIFFSFDFFLSNPKINPFFWVLFLTSNFVCYLLNLLFVYFTDFGYPSFPKLWPYTSGKGNSGPRFTLFQIFRKTFGSNSKASSK